MDRLNAEQRRRNMQAIKSSNTKIEVLLGKELWKRGYRYRKNNKTVFGKPDFTMKKYKIAIFCDSEFWHGKDWQFLNKRLQTNRTFWVEKIERNIKRDLEVNNKLNEDNWHVIRFWGQDIIKNVHACVDQLKQFIPHEVTIGSI